MNDHFWTKFWIDHGTASTDLDPQTRVFRTLNRTPISDSAWASTLEYISGKIALSPEHRLLDLGGGNGLIAIELAKSCADVTVVDISRGLLDGIANDDENITGVHSDMRDVRFDDGSFDRIMIYAALQYLTLAESAALLKRIAGWLAPNGLLFIGDIPDSNLQWGFYNTPERRAAYFDGLRSDRPIVGTWFERSWMSQLAADCGFRVSENLDQPKQQIYSWFRFDAVWTK